MKRRITTRVVTADGTLTTLGATDLRRKFWECEGEQEQAEPTYIF